MKLSWRGDFADGAANHYAVQVSRPLHEGTLYGYIVRSPHGSYEAYAEGRRDARRLAQAWEDRAELAHAGRPCEMSSAGAGGRVWCLLCRGGA